MAQLLSVLPGMDWLPWAQGPRLTPSAMAGERVALIGSQGEELRRVPQRGAGRAGRDGLRLRLYSIPCIQIPPEPLHSRGPRLLQPCVSFPASLKAPGHHILSPPPSHFPQSPWKRA